MLNKDKLYSLSIFKTYRFLIMLTIIGFLINIVSVYTNTKDLYGSGMVLKEVIFVIITICISFIYMYYFMYTYNNKNVNDTFERIVMINLIIFLIGISLSIIMVFLPNTIVPYINGAKRWIITPFFSISPIEMIKYGFLFLIAFLFSTNKFIFHLDKKHSFELYTPFYVFFLFLTIFVVFFQKDFGNFVLLSTIFIFVVFIYFKKNTSLYFFSIVILLLFVLFIISEEHRVSRFLSWFYSIYSVEEGVNFNNYQILQGLYTINEGLLTNIIFGCGLFESVLKVKVPELYTDMVFVTVISETGLFGLLMYFSFMMLLTYQIYIKTKNTTSFYIYVYSFVIISYFWITIFINLLGVLGIIPFKGISVPFLSYGGSNLLFNILILVNFIIMNFLISVKETRNKIGFK